jgi:hypothetical protein
LGTNSTDEQAKPPQLRNSMLAEPLCKLLKDQLFHGTQKAAVCLVTARICVKIVPAADDEQLAQFKMSKVGLRSADISRQHASKHLI